MVTVRRQSFTLIEVLVAMAIVAITLLPLLQMQIRSVEMWDRAQSKTTASLIANAHLAETLAAEKLNNGTTSGQDQDPDRGRVYYWQVRVTDYKMPAIDDQEVHGLHRVAVSVSWRDGTVPQRVTLSTYVAPVN